MTDRPFRARYNNTVSKNGQNRLKIRRRATDPNASTAVRFDVANSVNAAVATNPFAVTKEVLAMSTTNTAETIALGHIWTLILVG